MAARTSFGGSSKGLFTDRVENAHGLKVVLAKAVEAVKEGRGAVAGVLLEDDEDIRNASHPLIFPIPYGIRIICFQRSIAHLSTQERQRVNRSRACILEKKSCVEFLLPGTNTDPNPESNTMVERRSCARPSITRAQEPHTRKTKSRLRTRAPPTRTISLFSYEGNNYRNATKCILLNGS